MGGATDYLVIGCGATAMALVDSLLAASDSHITIVDKRPAPGGHWNDAYPFVRLHQPSAGYGVVSRPLGHDRVEDRGINAGFLELASGIEVTDYFHRVMSDVFLPSGRVDYFPMSEGFHDGRITSLLSGETRTLDVRRKVIDATIGENAIPLTHTPAFEVEEGVSRIPPNDLPRRAHEFSRFTVLGGGKTAMDCLVWLLGAGAAPEDLTWVAPRDSWLINRATTQPGLQYFDQTIGSLADQLEAMSKAGSFADIAAEMERLGVWLRVDPQVEPRMMHGATICEAEMEALRTVGKILRQGRVQRIEQNRMILEKGEAEVAPDTLFIDCTASALNKIAGDTGPVFDANVIRPKMIRLWQPTFSAALIGHIEAVVEDEAEKQKLAQVSPMTDAPESWLAAQAASFMNQGRWSSDRRIKTWLGNRLDIFGGTLRAARGDAEKGAVMMRIGAAIGPATINIARLARQTT